MGLGLGPVKLWHGAHLVGVGVRVRVRVGVRVRVRVTLPQNSSHSGAIRRISLRWKTWYQPT